MPFLADHHYMYRSPPNGAMRSVGVLTPAGGVGRRPKGRRQHLHRTLFPRPWICFSLVDKIHSFGTFPSASVAPTSPSGPLANFLECSSSNLKMFSIFLLEQTLTDYQMEVLPCTAHTASGNHCQHTRRRLVCLTVLSAETTSKSLQASYSFLDEAQDIEVFTWFQTSITRRHFSFTGCYDSF